MQIYTTVKPYLPDCSKYFQLIPSGRSGASHHLNAFLASSSLSIFDNFFIFDVTSTLLLEGVDFEDLTTCCKFLRFCKILIEMVFNLNFVRSDRSVVTSKVRWWGCNIIACYPCTGGKMSGRVSLIRFAS